MSYQRSIRERFGWFSWPMDVIAGLSLAALVCLFPGVLDRRTQLLIPALIAGWIALNSWDLGRHRFLSRFIRTVLHVAVVALPPMLVIWLGLRSAVQDLLLHNRLFPLLKGDEMSVPGAWLPALIALLVSLPFVSALGRKGARGSLVAVVVALLIGGVATGGSYLVLRPEKPGARKPGSAAQPDDRPDIASVTYHFTMANGFMTDVELVVNGVNLGTLPISITDEEFHAKVPPHDSKPVGGAPPSLFLPGENSAPGLYRMQIYDADLKIGLFTNSYVANRYVAYCRYHGTRSLITSARSVSGKTGDDGHCDISIPVYAKLPGREAVIRQYVDYALVRDCKVPGEWYDAIEPLFPEIGMRLYRDIQDPEQLQRLREGWANHRYHIDKVDSSEAAWEVLEAIAKDVQENSPTYDTGSFHDSPLELLAPKLDIDQLLDAGCDYLDQWRTDPIRSDFIVYVSRRGRVEFIVGYTNGTVTYPKEPLTTDSRVLTYGKKWPPDRAWVIAHALLARHYQYLREEHPCPSPIQARLTPALLRFDYTHHKGLLAAAFLGGPDADKYILQAPWRVPFGELPEDEQKASPTKANRYLLAAAWLQTEAGRLAREAHPDVVGPMFGRPPARGLNYQLLQFTGHHDLELQPWWDQMLSKQRSAGIATNVDSMWSALQHTGEFATPDRYVEAFLCWPRRGIDLENTMHLLDEFPAELRSAVGKAIQEHLSRPDPDRDKALRAGGLTTARELKEVKQATAGIRRASNWRSSFDAKRLSAESADKLQVWLENNSPSPLIPLLATSDKPEHRWFAVTGILANPSSEYRKLLDALARDPDVNVRLRAIRARKELKDFAQLPVGKIPDHLCPPAPWYQ